MVYNTGEIAKDVYDSDKVIKDTLEKSVIIPGNKTEEKYNENG